MDSEAPTSVHRRLTPLALLLCATAAAVNCGDHSPVGVELQAPALPASKVIPLLATGTSPSGTTKTGLVSCAQRYDSVTQVIGPAGGSIAVGPHVLWINALVLTTRVRITAVAPSGPVRSVRFHPDGLIFPTTPFGPGARLHTDYTTCGVPTNSVPRIAQVSDSQSILGYLQTSIHIDIQGVQHVVAVLSHFSNYAIAW